MTKTLAEARDFVDRIAPVPVPAGVQPFVLPSHTSLAAVRDRLPADSPVLLGAQNAHWAPDGAWTGEVSMRMAADAGAQLIEIGHSERREHFGETDATVAAKVAAALDHGLTPLVCVGEPLRYAKPARRSLSSLVRSALPSGTWAPPTQAGCCWRTSPSGRSARPVGPPRWRRSRRCCGASSTPWPR